MNEETDDQKPPADLACAPLRAAWWWLWLLVDGAEEMESTMVKPEGRFLGLRGLSDPAACRASYTSCGQ